MKTLSKSLWGPLLALLMAAFQSLAQPPEEANDRTPYSQAELDQMAAPIALYPDSLLAQVLMAATYPIEVVQAARWSRAHPNLSGEEAVRAVAEFDWDPSVKSLVAFPRLLQQLDERLDWTERLGNAFLGQEYELMRTVQQLRWHAYSAGNLKSGNELNVRLEGTDFYLDSPVPEVVYIPSYDPRVAYGTWDWPAYEPVYWSPWPVVAVPVSAGFFFGTCDWGARHVRLASYRPFYHRNVHRWTRGGLWRHDPDHRRGVAYRNVNVRHQLQRGDRVDIRGRARDVRTEAGPQIVPAPQVPAAMERRVEANELQRPSQPGIAIPRAEVRTGGGLARPVATMPAPSEPRYQALERTRPGPMPPPLQAVPQTYEASPLARPMEAAPQVQEPSPLARPMRSVPQPAQVAAPAPSAPAAVPVSAPVPAAAALVRPEAPSPPPQSQPSSGIERGDLRRRER